MPNFGIYSGEQLLDLDLEKRKFIVDGIIKERDNIIIAGDDKTGKSLFMLQMCMSMTSGHSFLDEYKISHPCKISYLQLEGELEDTQDRIKIMMKSIDFNPALFQLLFLPELTLEKKEVMQRIEKDITSYHIPNLIVIDPIYQALGGSLSDEMTVRQFNANIRQIKDNLNCAISGIHHTRKEYFTKDGRMETGVDIIFGSRFFRAFPDNVFLFKYDRRNNIRVLFCPRQRDNKTIKEIKTNLVEPDPLYFEKVEQHPTRENVIANILIQDVRQEGRTLRMLMDMTQLSESTVYRSLKKLRDKTTFIPKITPRRYLWNENTVTVK